MTVEAEGADVLYVALAGKHSIIPAAAIMNAAGERWTLSVFEAVNFAAFLGDAKKMQIIARRIHDEAVRLKVKEVAIVECGTAFRVDEVHDRRASLQGGGLRRADLPLPAGRDGSGCGRTR